MPFVITARQSGGGASTGSPFTTSSDTPTANSLLLLGDGAQNDSTNTAQSHATPTGGGLTYTQIGSSPAQVNWAGENVYATTGALWQAAIGSSPSAHTITLDALPDTTNAIYRPIACDITGYNPAAPIKQYAQNVVDTNPGGGGTNASGSITLGATPSNGNLIIVYFFVCDDNGGPLTAPTMGAGKTFTQINQSASAGVQATMWYRVADGSESTTITSSSLGTAVGNYYVGAVEIAALPAVTAWLTA